MFEGLIDRYWLQIAEICRTDMSLEVAIDLLDRNVLDGTHRRARLYARIILRQATLFRNYTLITDKEAISS